VIPAGKVKEMLKELETKPGGIIGYFVQWTIDNMKLIEFRPDDILGNRALYNWLRECEDYCRQAQKTEELRVIQDKLNKIQVNQIWEGENA